MGSKIMLISYTGNSVNNPPENAPQTLLNWMDKQGYRLFFHVVGFYDNLEGMLGGIKEFFPDEAGVAIKVISDATGQLGNRELFILEVDKLTDKAVMNMRIKEIEQYILMEHVSVV